MVFFLKQGVLPLQFRNIRKKTLLFACWIFSILLPPSGYASGVYGVHGNPAQLTEYAITKVWGSADREWIDSQQRQDREVFLTLNAFGGSSGWKQFPDAIPVLANGEKLQAKYGGICPTHKGWRQQQLDKLQQWLESFSGQRAFSGIWLDFIRYPGKWEEKNPAIPKTCYCDRCLTLFQQETETAIPTTLTSTPQKAAWIDQYAAEKWQQWKKEQILSFVKEARKIIDNNQPAELAKAEKIKLGAFLVPWRKSDFNGAVVSSLAQDAETMARYIDVFSPMVYHRMAHQPASWVREISWYFHNMGERAGLETWPAIQSADVGREEFSAALHGVEKSGAQDVIVYAMKDMQKALWSPLGRFSPQKSLLPFLPEEKRELSAPLAVCVPGRQYLFSAEFWRDNRENPDAYPEITLWGKEHLLNTHRITGKYQLVREIITCPQPSAKKQLFSFTSRYRDTPIFIKNPQIKPWEWENTSPSPAMDTIQQFFPIGIYGANAKNLATIKKLGVNTAVIALNKANIEACLAHNMRCTFSVPHQPEKLQQALKKYGPLLKRKEFLFYVNDEPALRSVPEWKTADIQRIVKQHFPASPTMMAVVRPRTVDFYTGGADYFMMDQYPVPSMPMNWLSDSMEEAAGHVGNHRLMSVIQAFGGAKYAASGWPRLPNFKEMYHLAILSVIHGSRGIYFFTFPEISQTREGLNDLTKVLQRLNSLRLWLNSQSDTKPTVTMVSKYKVDPAGKAAVHCALRERAATRMLLCVNVLPHPVRAKIDLKNSSRFTEYFTGEEFPDKTAKTSILDLDFSGLEVKILLEKK